MHELFFEINRTQGHDDRRRHAQPRLCAERMPRVVHVRDGRVEKDVRKAEVAARAIF